MNLSDKTKEALKKATDENDSKTLKWIETSIAKGYEGVGVIFYILDNKKISYVLGVNKKGEAEYPGGKVEASDSSKEATVQREVEEETGLYFPLERFVKCFEINGGTTGYPSYLFLVEISIEEFQHLKSKDGTFSKFIKVPEVIDCEQVHSNGTAYELRKFNRKYVLPQIKDSLIEYIATLV
jgi:8-oxo-dGTP pyrophosphatase MutT (NUDIX family)